MRGIRLQDHKGRICGRIDRIHDQVHRTGRIGARCQHQMTAQRNAGIAVQPVELVGNGLSGNFWHAVNRDIAEFTLGMGVDHADCRCGGHFPAAARSAVMVVRGEMASVEVTISTIAPVGESQARL